MRGLTISKLLVSVAPALWLGACANLRPAPSCEQFDAARKTLDYGTEYRRDDKEAVKPLRTGSAAMALQYRLELDSMRVRPCSHITIRKSLTLARRDDTAAVLEETREFFAEDGARIAIKQEDLTGQLRRGGRYTASVPLPIPKNAPTGTYHLVCTLTLKSKTGAQVLAKTGTSFEVVGTTK